MELNREAWAILTPDEQMALNLQHGHDKSSWEAGELMGKVHYKYLEIKYRAEHFLKLFTLHLNLYDGLIPQAVTPTMPHLVAKYLTWVIKERKHPKIFYLGSEDQSKKNVENELTTWVKANSDSKSLIILNFVNLVKEFDRWNNFRVLPKEVQEPSAFKRRNKNIDKKRIRVITNISPLSIDIIYRVCKSRLKSEIWCTLIPKEQEVKVFMVKPKESFRLTEVGIYLWPNKVEAEKYARVVKSYSDKETRNCLDGLNFWPEYREVIQTATNYHEIQKMYPSRRFLEMAVSKLQFYNQKK